ncbi:MAG: hypothetical protein GX175_03580, partial [Halanaerobiaceae bacterium]|nr:hypothetical protein [Halanaerobiaceae bacterium]
MVINSVMQSQILSLQQALGMAGIQMAMKQNGAVILKLIEGMEELSETIQEGVQPHIGGN